MSLREFKRPRGQAGKPGGAGKSRSDWTAEGLTDLATGYWQSAALSAAVTAGVFDALDRARRTCAELARRLNVSPAHLEKLLDALAGMGLLVKRGGLYAVAGGARRFLSPSGDKCMLDALRFNADLYALWGRLDQCLRRGGPVADPAGHLGSDPSRTRRFVLGMHSRALALAGKLMAAIDLRGCVNVLDVGSGPGTISSMLARRHKRLKVTLFDLPAVMDVARELLRGHPAASRIAFRPGDYHSDALGGPFDAVLYFGGLHQEAPASAAALFGKIRQALRPGGRLLVVDMMLEADKTRPAFSALFSVNMMLVSGSAGVYSANEVRGLLSRAGFVRPVLRRMTGSPYWLISARRPATA